MYCTSTDDTGTGTKGTDSACTGAYGSSSSNTHSFKICPSPTHYTTLHSHTQPTTAPNNSHSPQPDHSVTSAMQDRNSLGGGHIHRPDKALAA